MVLTDEERAILADKLGDAHVELLPPHDGTPEAERPYSLEAVCVVGLWSKHLGIRSIYRLDEPGRHRAHAVREFAEGFKDAAPHLFPVRA